jgi:flagellar basal body-associated protein FliL
MSVVLQVLLLVVAIVVAVAGIGVALALRLSSRQQAARLRRRPSGAASAVVPESRMGKVVPLASARAAAAQRQAQATEPAASPATPNPPLTPEPAHQAKLVALQALLALGDAQAERAAKSGRGHFADTQPAEDDPSTQFLDRLDPAQPVSLLNLDKLPARRGLKT